MMKNIIILITLLSSFLFAQNSVEVHGTSTLHDWKMISNSVAVDMVEENNKITKLEVSFVVETLKSDDSSLDENAYEAMNVDTKELIMFKLIEHKDDGSLDGTFSVGKVEKRYTVIPTLIENGKIEGSLKMNMSTLGIEPPSFLFGAMSTGDEVEIKYSISK